MKKTLNGVIILFTANIISKIFGAIYRIPLSNLLGAEGMGIYQMAFPIYSFLLTFITGGISVALTKKIAKEKAIGNVINSNKHFLTAKKLCFLYGIIFLFFLLIFAYPFSILQGNISAFWGYLAISIGFIFACMLGAYRGYYQGLGDMMPTAISQVIEQLTKLVLGIILSAVLIKYGILCGVFGALLGVSLSEIISFAYFYIKTSGISKGNAYKTNKRNLTTFFNNSLPISISYSIMPLSTLIDSFLIVNLLTLSGFPLSFSTSLYGIETGMILPLINMPNVLISAIAISSIQDISYKSAKNISVANSIENILRAVYIFILPCVVGLFFLSDNFIKIIYPNLNAQMASIASLLLKFSAFEMFFLCFISVTNAVLQALGKTKVPVISLSIGVLIKTLLTVILVRINSINIFGVVVASIFGYYITSMVNIIKIKRISSARLGFIHLFMPLFACTVIGMLLLAYLYLFNKTNLIGMFIIILLSAIIYFGILIITKQLSLGEIKQIIISKRT